MYPDVAFSKSFSERIFMERVLEDRTRPCMATLWWAMAAAGYATAGPVTAAQQGRMAAQCDQAQERRAETQRRHISAKATWKDSDLPPWLDEKVYRREIQPRQADFTFGSGCETGNFNTIRGGHSLWTTNSASTTLANAGATCQCFEHLRKPDGTDCLPRSKCSDLLV